MADPSPFADISGLTTPSGVPEASSEATAMPKFPEPKPQKYLPPDPMTQAEAFEALETERAKLPSLETMNRMDTLLDQGAGMFDWQGMTLGVQDAMTFGLTGKLVGEERTKWKGRGWSFGTTERDDQLRLLQELVLEESPDKTGKISADDIQNMMRRIIVDALNEDVYRNKLSATRILRASVQVFWTER